MSEFESLIIDHLMLIGRHVLKQKMLKQFLFVLITRHLSAKYTPYINTLHFRNIQTINKEQRKSKDGVRVALN